MNVRNRNSSAVGWSQTQTQSWLKVLVLYKEWTPGLKIAKTKNHESHECSETALDVTQRAGKEIK